MVDAPRPKTQDPLWGYTFDMLDSMRTDMRYVKDDMRDLQNDMKNLTNTTNHRLDKFTEALSKKADKSELIVPVAGRFLNTWRKRFFAFTAGIAGVLTAGFVIYDQVIERFF